MGTCSFLPEACRNHQLFSCAHAKYPLSGSEQIAVMLKPTGLFTFRLQSYNLPFKCLLKYGRCTPSISIVQPTLNRKQDVKAKQVQGNDLKRCKMIFKCPDISFYKVISVVLGLQGPLESCNSLWLRAL